MPVISNNVKISLFHSDILKQEEAVRSSSVAVQHYEYTLDREVNAYGEASGSNAGFFLQATVRVGSRDDLKIYYEGLKNTFPSSFTFVMNAGYDDSDRLTDYDGALVCEGYIMDVDESYRRGSESESGEQMCLVFRMLLTSMEFVGTGKNLVRRFSCWE